MATYIKTLKEDSTGATPVHTVGIVPATTIKLYGSVNNQAVRIRKLYGSVNGRSKLIFEDNS